MVVGGQGLLPPAADEGSSLLGKFRVSDVDRPLDQASMAAIAIAHYPDITGS